MTVWKKQWRIIMPVSFSSLLQILRIIPYSLFQLRMSFCKYEFFLDNLGLLGWATDSSQGLCLHRATQIEEKLNVLILEVVMRRRQCGHGHRFCDFLQVIALMRQSLHSVDTGSMCINSHVKSGHDSSTLDLTGNYLLVSAVKKRKDNLRRKLAKTLRLITFIREVGSSNSYRETGILF
jgi:hypothetical protein